MKDKAIEAWGKQKRLGIVPVSNEKIYWFAVLSESPGGKDNPNELKDFLKNLFSDFHPFASELIKSTPLESIIRNDLYDFKPLKKWFEGRVCLIGDAGHATTPNMGQGGCQAVEDAWSLHSAFSRTKNVEEAFDIFQRKRIKKTSRITNQSFSMGQMAHWKYGQGIRNAMLKLLPESISKKGIEWVLKI